MEPTKRPVFGGVEYEVAANSSPTLSSAKRTSLPLDRTTSGFGGAALGLACFVGDLGEFGGGAGIGGESGASYVCAQAIPGLRSEIQGHLA